MNTKEKLVELLDRFVYDEWYGNEDIAEKLVSNGVTVQKYGYWVSYQTDETYGSMDDKEWYKCSKCGKDAYGRCYEDEWYSAPILSAYCPHCGTKMMLQQPAEGVNNG